MVTVEHDQDQFVVHVHVVPADSDEVVAQRGLVQALRQDPVLREEYTDLKRSIVGSGTTDPVPYSMGTIRWVLATLERLGLPSLPDPGCRPRALMCADRHPFADGPERFAACLESTAGFEVELVADPG